MSQSYSLPSASERPEPSPTNAATWWERNKLAAATAGCAVFLILGSVARALGAPAGLSLLLYAAAYVAGGAFSTWNGLQTLVRERRIDVDLLMVLAAVAAASIDEWVEGGVLLFLFSLSNALQEYALQRTRRAITSLMNLRPREALRFEANGETVLVAVDELQIGDMILVRPGELIPIDGVIETGTSFLDESSITGESIPVEKGAGDEVFAGTLNQHGSLEVRVTKLAGDTMLAKIIRMVEEAQSEEAPMQRKIDAIEQYYAAGVVLITIAAAIIPVAFGHPWPETLYRAITLMVVASPCAVAMSAPAPIVAAIANGARSGVLFKGGIHIEHMATIDAVALDKTGTLTEGAPSVTDVVPVGQWDRAKVLRVAAGIERRSEHPLAAAIVDAATAEGVEPAEAAEAEAIPGRGIVAQVDGEEVWIGNRHLALAKGASIPDDVRRKAEAMEREGKTVMYLGSDRLHALIAAMDQVRPSAAAALRRLRAAGIRHIVMLTGDNERAAAAVAKIVGVDEYYAEMLPQDKAQKIEELRAKYGRIAMVGDGVNDAPALARATTGVAMGAAGTDVALDTSDVVLMTNDLDKLVHAVILGRRTQRIIWQNLIFSLAVIAGLVVAVLSADLVLALGVVGHEGSTLLVIANSLRLLWGTHRS